MRKIVKEQAETISIDQINDDSIIGIEWPKGEKSIVIYNGKFLSLGNDNILIDEAWESRTMKMYIWESMNEDTKGTPYQFDSVKECLKWMSE